MTNYLVRVFDLGGRYELWVPAFSIRSWVADPKLVEKEAIRLISANSYAVKGFSVDLRSEYGDEPFDTP